MLWGRSWSEQPKSSWTTTVPQSCLLSFWSSYFSLLLFLDCVTVLDSYRSPHKNDLYDLQAIWSTCREYAESLHIPSPLAAWTSRCGYMSVMKIDEKQIEEGRETTSFTFMHTYTHTPLAFLCTWRTLLLLLPQKHSLSLFPGPTAVSLPVKRPRFIYFYYILMQKQTKGQFH